MIDATLQASAAVEMPVEFVEGAKVTLRPARALCLRAAALPCVRACLLCASVAADCILLTRPSRYLQQRILGRWRIDDAARAGDVALVQDHLLANPACVNDRRG